MDVLSTKEEQIPLRFNPNSPFMGLHRELPHRTAPSKRTYLTPALGALHSILQKLELIQTHMTQKPVLWVEVGALNARIYRAPLFWRMLLSNTEVRFPFDCCLLRS